jgi:hypothetical protein
MATRRAGVAYLTIDGDAWDVVGDLSYSAQTVTRETLVGQSGVHGYSEMPKAGFISATLRTRSDATSYSLASKTNTTIVAQLANGSTVYGANMWQTGDIEIKTQEATFTVRFDGIGVTETTV